MTMAMAMATASRGVEEGGNGGARDFNGGTRSTFHFRETNGNVWTMLARRSAIGERRVEREQIAPKRSSRFLLSDRVFAFFFVLSRHRSNLIASRRVTGNITPRNPSLF